MTFGQLGRSLTLHTAKGNQMGQAESAILLALTGWAASGQSCVGEAWRSACPLGWNHSDDEHKAWAELKVAHFIQRDYFQC